MGHISSAAKTAMKAESSKAAQSRRMTPISQVKRIYASPNPKKRFTKPKK
jgi:hypothetical protein